MQKRIVFPLLIICIGILVVAGCTNSGSTNATMQATLAPSQTTSAKTPSPITTIERTIPTTTVAIVNKTTVIKPDPTDVSQISFSHYSNDDFSVDYPSEWNVSESTFTSYYCLNDLNPMSHNYTICYQNETRDIGPFDFYETYWDNGVFQPISQVVMFTSGDGTLKFSSFTSDFTPPAIGDYRLKPMSTLDWCRAQFELNYPNLSASDYIENYKYFEEGNGNTRARRSIYDVTLPKDVALPTGGIMPMGPQDYPLKYTRETAVTLHHVYDFAFMDRNIDPNRYHNLGEYIISSITTTDGSI